MPSLEITEHKNRERQKQARKFWDRFEVGDGVKGVVRKKRGSCAVSGRIIHKNIHYMGIMWKDRILTISFTDILSGQIKITHRFKQSGVQDKR
jgi:hypothetical protein